MYQERMFHTWQEGLIHFIVVVAIPLVPIVIYMMTKSTSDSYLYVLLLTVIISLAYEFLSMPQKCSTFLKVENIICCSILTIMFIWTFFLLNYSSGSEAKERIGVADYILVFLFIIPVIVTIIEIVRCVVFDIKSSKVSPDDNNLKGAATV